VQSFTHSALTYTGPFTSNLSAVASEAGRTCGSKSMPRRLAGAKGNAYNRLRSSSGAEESA